HLPPILRAASRLLLCGQVRRRFGAGSLRALAADGCGARSRPITVGPFFHRSTPSGPLARNEAPERDSRANDEAMPAMKCRTLLVTSSNTSYRTRTRKAAPDDALGGFYSVRCGACGGRGRGSGCVRCGSVRLGMFAVRQLNRAQNQVPVPPWRFCPEPPAPAAV
ncbi:MAG: hypothetical protein ACI9C2_002120, partial [Gammaproteobacteria bacterium]